MIFIGHVRILFLNIISKLVRFIIMRTFRLLLDFQRVLFFTLKTQATHARYLRMVGKNHKGENY